MRIGFTGPRTGLTLPQRVSLAEQLQKFTTITEFIHGCCVGADETAGELMLRLRPTVPIVGYPSTWPAMVSAEAVSGCAELYRPLPPLERNWLIVERCDLLLAVVDGPERLRSGTWATIRRARAVSKSLSIIWPDGVSTVSGN